MCVAKLAACIDDNAAAGFPNVITFSGMRRGMPDDVGLENTVTGAETSDRPGRAEEGEPLPGGAQQPGERGDERPSRLHVRQGGMGRRGLQANRSERMKILFDIYHVQIMQGDIITRIRQYHPYIGHYHVAGVPGRNEIDARQEINYPAIMRAILATG